MSGESPIPFINGPYPVRPGNSLRLLLDGGPAFERVCEAIESAQHSVWATVTFMWPEFRMPGGRGTALEVLAKAARRGVEVRLIFWRPDDETASLRRNAFWGAAEHFDELAGLGADLEVRWDRAHPGFCQHQKTWLMDASRDGQTAFLGGLNLNPNSLAWPGHAGEGQNHDFYLELRGPSVADLHHNFAQRWNGASERDAPEGLWGETGRAALPFPERVPVYEGHATVQIQRTTHAGRYADGHAAVGGLPFDAAAGERTIFEQYLGAIGAARRTIYLENQYLEMPEIVEALHGALGRGVEVVCLMPAVPALSPGAYDSPERRAFFEARAALGRYDTFTLAGLAGLGADGLRKPVYVHSKLMLVDDAWATLGSANLHRFSLLGNGELNAAVYSPEAVKSIRVELLAEHLGQDTSGLNDLEALHLFRRVALDNRAQLSSGETDWQGIAFALNVATYGLAPQFP